MGTLRLVAVFSAFASTATAQEANGINTLMDLCVPISATGTSVRAGLHEAGWLELSKPDAAGPLANLIASQMWHLAASSTPEMRLNLTGDYTDAFYASLGNNMLGPIFTKGDQVALVLASEANLSCMWAGPESDALLFRIEAIGGFPTVDGTVTGAKTQTVEAGGTNYTRIETYAFIDRTGSLPYAARLDRSPIQ